MDLQHQLLILWRLGSASSQSSHIRGVKQRLCLIPGMGGSVIITTSHHNIHMIPKGTKVRILNNRHPDVLAGMVGEIDCFHEGGYGVAIDGCWMIAGGDRGQVYRGVEVVWYETHEFELV